MTFQQDVGNSGVAAAWHDLRGYGAQASETLLRPMAYVSEFRVNTLSTSFLDPTPESPKI